MESLNHVYWSRDFIFICAGYGSPSPHRHFAKHIMIAQDGVLDAEVDDHCLSCHGLIIDSMVEHTIHTDIPVLLFFIDEVTPLANTVRRKYLSQTSHLCISKETALQMQGVWRDHREDVSMGLIYQLLDCLGLSGSEADQTDSRISAALEYVRSQENDSVTLEMTAKHVNLSPGRLSHLFTGELGASYKQCLENLKLEKAVFYLLSGENITASCLRAGFSSSSHFAAACRRIYGFPMSYLLKNIEFIKTR